MQLSQLTASMAGDFGLRFALVDVLPTALQIFVVALLWLGGAPAAAPDIPAAVAKLTEEGGAASILALSAVFLLALVLHPFQLGMVRLLEGYWGTGRWIAWLSDARRKAYERARERLVEAQEVKPPKLDDASEEQIAVALEAEVVRAGAAARELEQRFPSGADRVLPTALGNALRAGEDRGGAAYGLDLVVVWPALYAVMPDSTRALVDDRRDAVDRAARLCTSFGVMAPVTLALTFRLGVWMLVPLSAALLSWLCYRGAVTSGIAYARMLRTCVDLHRFDMLSALHLPLPVDISAEVEANRALSDFLRQNAPTPLTYEHPG